ncbi:MAG: hypothetical protein BWK78_01600 [Thiotrichaceae bacterium IS1]|nr:MAG: hypothetical protein BWK78_01600 [Thiotrichaceae bacterium IS1]
MSILNPIENIKPLWTWLVGIGRAWGEPIWKGFRWFLLTTLFGLSQMWLVLGVYYFPGNPRNLFDFIIMLFIALMILMGIVLFSRKQLLHGASVALFAWFVLMWALLAKNNFLLGADVPLENFIKDGAILFLSIAIVSSLAMDYYVFTSKAMFGEESLNILAFIFFPIILIYGAAGFFTFCYLAPHELDSNFIFQADLVILLITCGYSIFIKAKAFFDEQQKQLDIPSNS